MSIERITRMLKVLWLIRSMPVGEGWETSHAVTRWSGVSHSTTYRYLPKLVQFGYVELRKSGTITVHPLQYRITEDGRSFIEKQGELFV